MLAKRNSVNFSSKLLVLTLSRVYRILEIIHVRLCRVQIKLVNRNKIIAKHRKYTIF